MGFLIALLIIIGGTGATAFAADKAVPGDMLYPIDLLVEDARLNVAKDDTERNKLELEFAQERVEEAYSLIGSTSPLSDEADEKSDSDGDISQETVLVAKDVSLTTAIRELERAKDTLETKTQGKDEDRDNTLKAIDDILDKLVSISSDNDLIIDTVTTDVSDDEKKASIDVEGETDNTKIHYSIDTEVDDNGYKKVETRSTETERDIDIESDDNTTIYTSDDGSIHIETQVEDSGDGNASASVKSNISGSSNSSVSVTKTVVEDGS